MATDTKRKSRLGLLIPGFNEELIISSTIKSAIAAGLNKKDIYVVDDGSTDNTVKVAKKNLSDANVLAVEHSGKAMALKKAIDYFNLPQKYTWLHISDADSIFCHDYFNIFRKRLNVTKYSAAVGFVQSMKENWLTRYRCFSYTYGQHIQKRLQSWIGAIVVLPGPVTCYRTNIIERLDFSNKSLTEDFDLTLQIHRKKLGKIKFIPEAVNYTQDPKTLKDFVRQTLRWQRGFYQGIRQYKIGFKLQLIDLTVIFQLIENLYYSFQFLVVLPLLLINFHDTQTLVTILITDMVMLVLLATFSAYVAKRPDVFLSLPYYYFLKIIEIGIFYWAFVEVIMLEKFIIDKEGWDTRNSRRYAIKVPEEGSSLGDV